MTVEVEPLPTGAGNVEFDRQRLVELLLFKNGRRDETKCPSSDDEAEFLKTAGTSATITEQETKNKNTLNTQRRGIDVKNATATLKPSSTLRIHSTTG